MLFSEENPGCGTRGAYNSPHTGLEVNEARKPLHLIGNTSF
jgi:hypothetical protein